MDEWMNVSQREGKNVLILLEVLVLLFAESPLGVSVVQRLGVWLWS